MESVKKAFARQRAKDLAEHTKATLAKEKELENLRKKCQELSDKLSNGAQSTVQVCCFQVTSFCFITEYYCATRTCEACLNSDLNERCTQRVSCLLFQVTLNVNIS